MLITCTDSVEQVTATSDKLRRTHTHTHPFNGPFSGTTRVRRYQKGKTNLDFTEARDSEWQWHQLGICKSAPRSRQITTPAPHHSVFTGWMPFLPPNQQHQSTEDKLRHFNKIETSEKHQLVPAQFCVVYVVGNFENFCHVTS